MRPPDRRDFLRFRVPLAIVAFALAWYSPSAAIVLVLPFLFFVPGWLLVVRCVPRLSPAGAAGVAVVASAFLSAHATNLVATVGVATGSGGLTRPNVLATVALLAGLSWVLAIVDLPGMAPPPSLNLRGGARFIRRRPEPWLIAIGTGVVVGGVLAASAWHQTAEGWISGGWNWSDFLVHVAIGQSLVEGNFPPQVPYFSGVPLSYHWFADLHGAIVALATGQTVIPVFIASNALMASVLALVGWELAWRITRSRRAAAIGALLLVAGGGMGWIRLLLDLSQGTSDLVTLVSNNPYDNSWADGWPWFRIGSVFGTGLLTHRATAFGLPALVAVVLIAHASIGRRRVGMALAGLLAALLAPFHFYALPAAYLLVLLLFVTGGRWKRQGSVGDLVVFMAPVVLALPFIAGPILLQVGHGAFRFVGGWSEARFQEGPLAIAFFYLTNLGLPFVLALVAFLRRDLPERGLLVAWTASLFLVPNLVVVSAVEFDMNKYFQMMWVAVAIAAGWLVRRWPRPIVAAVVAFAALSPALVGFWSVTSRTVALTDPQERAAQWIASSTRPGSVFVTDTWINSPVDLAGRLRVTSFGPYVSNLGFNPDERAADVQRLRCDGPEAAAAVMERYGATYVLSSGGALECGDRTPTDLSSSPRFETAYSVDGVTIWRLKP
ncbi:MAG TPA: hypothetical protein VES19_05120 [Candidatus Limnocylindrales bacterium]|nr:hypothetical protein [Candidatus Limnocylindrales bacterium]